MGQFFALAVSVLTTRGLKLPASLSVDWIFQGSVVLVTIGLVAFVLLLKSVRTMAENDTRRKHRDMFEM
jgi:hypothetical protein